MLQDVRKVRYYLLCGQLIGQRMEKPIVGSVEHVTVQHALHWRISMLVVGISLVEAKHGETFIYYLSNQRFASILIGPVCLYLCH